LIYLSLRHKPMVGRPDFMESTSQCDQRGATRYHVARVTAGYVAGSREMAMKTLLVAFVLIFCAAVSVRASDGISICAEHTDPDDWQDEFGRGAVVVPAGTIFNYAGHLMGRNLQDPKGDATNSKDLSKQEKKRRSDLLIQDMATDQKNTSAVATTQQIILTASEPCALAPAEAVLSKQWGWTVTPIVGDSALYYQIYGIIRRGALDTNFDADDVPVNHLAARGQLNGSVRGTLRITIKLDEWTASHAPDELSVAGKGNSECWGDDDRQDISCRSLTENFLLSMRGTTKAEVLKAMNVRGREISGGLRFLSNYSKGARWGSGSVNFTFDDKSRVSVITASIDPPNMAGKSVDFIWNVYAAPPLGEEIDRSTKDFARHPYCSDFSGDPTKCTGLGIDGELTRYQMSFGSDRAELLRALDASCNLVPGIVARDPAGDCDRLRSRLR
jgi:hypothetical protein